MNKIALRLTAAGSLALSVLGGCASNRTEAPPARLDTAQLQAVSAEASQQARTYAEVEKRTRLKDFWFP